MKNQNIFIFFIMLLLVAAASFFAGTKYQEKKRPNIRGQFEGNFGERTGGMSKQAQQGMGNRGGFRPVTGEIINSDDKSITVMLQDGSSKIIFLSQKTTINKANAATKSDLKKGEKVAVFGSENPDGSVTAQNIQLNPQLKMMKINPTQ